MLNFGLWMIDTFFWTKHEVEINIGLNSENVCYCSRQKLPCSHLLSKNVKFKIRKNRTLPISHGQETWFFTLRAEHKLRTAQNSFDESFH
jgi:hypothetical protein